MKSRFPAGRYPCNILIAPVLQQLCIDGFRATQLRQGKTQSAGNGQRALAKDCNAAVTQLGGSRRARREALICGVTLACISDG